MIVQGLQCKPITLRYRDRRCLYRSLGGPHGPTGTAATVAAGTAAMTELNDLRKSS
jgi:hypothetical protein